MACKPLEDYDVQASGLSRRKPRVSRLAHGVKRAPLHASTTNTVTESMSRLPKYRLDQGRRAYPERVERPRTRAECPPDGEVCGFVSCKYHMAIDVSPANGSIKFNAPITIGDDGVPDLDLTAMSETCALRAAERGGMTLEEIGAAFNLTRERVRMIEQGALAQLRGEVRR